MAFVTLLACGKSFTQGSTQDTKTHKTAALVTDAFLASGAIAFGVLLLLHTSGAVSLGMPSAIWIFGPQAAAGFIGVGAALLLADLIASTYVFNPSASTVAPQLISAERDSVTAENVRKFTFPPREEEPYFDQVAFPACFYDRISRDETLHLNPRSENGTNAFTLVKVNGRYFYNNIREIDGCYPANYVSTKATRMGEPGQTPYLVAAAPNLEMNERAQAQVFYRMIEQTHSSCIVSLESPSILNLLSSDISFNYVKKIEFSSGITYDIYTTDSIGDNVIFEIVLNTDSCTLPKLDQCFWSVYYLHRVITRYHIPISNEHPLIMSCSDGVDMSPFYVMLYDLISHPENSNPFELIGEDFVDQFENLAQHVESQVSSGAGVDYLSDLLNSLRGGTDSSELLTGMDASSDSDDNTLDPDLRRIFAESIRYLWGEANNGGGNSTRSSVMSLN